MLISDVTMPGLTGPELAALVRQRVPALRVRFMSGSPREASSTPSGRLAEYDGLTKPFSGRELLVRVAEVFAESAPSSDRRG